jgi:hypothetical protein
MGSPKKEILFFVIKGHLLDSLGIFTHLEKTVSK